MRRMMVLVSGLLLVMGLVGWGERKRYGAPIDEQAPVATLKQIGADPAAYKDKGVVLKGNYGFYCCPADFSYKEGLDVVAVSPQGFDSPKLKTGTPIAVYGVVRTGHPPEKEKGESSEKAEPEAQFHIEAKGVALR